MIEELRKTINKKLNKEDTHCFNNLENIIDNEYDIDELSEDWKDNGKYSIGTMIYKIKYKNQNYILTVYQSRSGSYFSDYYYNNPDSFELKTEEDYYKSNKVYTFTEHGYTFSIYKDKNNNYTFKDETGI